MSHEIIKVNPRNLLFPHEPLATSGTQCSFRCFHTQAIYFCDFVFGNELEASVYGEAAGWGSDIATVALKIASQPKRSGHRPRCVVFTQGQDETVVACGGVISSFPVPLLPKEKLVDTNGAGERSRNLALCCLAN